LTNKDIKRLERLKKKATEDTLEPKAATKVMLNVGDSDIQLIERNFEQMEKQNVFNDKKVSHEEKLHAEREILNVEKEHAKKTTVKKSFTEKMQY